MILEFDTHFEENIYKYKYVGFDCRSNINIDAASISMYFFFISLAVSCLNMKQPDTYIHKCMY